MKTLLLTNEFPPEIYGGAGVHVDYLTRELAKLCEVDVRAFGSQNREEFEGRLKVKGYGVDKTGWDSPEPLQSIFAALQRGVDWNAAGHDADIVHVHTWYAHFGGLVAKLCYGIPLVITVHSLEPLRPWKREQLGGGYDFSCWIERTCLEMADAVIAVSEGTKADVLEHFDIDPGKIHVIYNGIDADEYQPVDEPKMIRKLGVDPDTPYVLFVGRITRQKGIVHLVNAIEHLDPGLQVVLCAGAPDTPEIAEEMRAAIARAREIRTRKPGSAPIVWIEEMVSVPQKVALYSHATVFCCPSIYEPFGIINLEAMACGTPVVGSALGGMLEIILPGETGALVELDQHRESPFEPLRPPEFSEDLAKAINAIAADPDKAKAMGEKGRQRSVEVFSWAAIAEQTAELYRELSS